MKRPILLFLTLLSLFVVSIPPCMAATESTAPDSTDLAALKVCEGVIRLFERHSDEIWPGYNLARQPFIVYRPEAWVLLFNSPGPIEGFGGLPAAWPNLHARMLYHAGSYKDLVGQLAFDMPVDSLTAAAVGISDKPAVVEFGFIVHEAFHQFQHQAFGDIPWEREEKYPLEDTENTALAVLEMCLLRDALIANHPDCRDLLNQFVAVRKLRWERDDFVGHYEQGQEINEGTAKYVECRCVELAGKLKYKSAVRDGRKSLREEISEVAKPSYLLRDFQDRLCGMSVSPEDMPRNRIYPVGAAQGMLLDKLGIPWKAQAQAAGTEFSFAGLLREKLPVDSSAVIDLLTRAKNRYGYPAILAASDSLIQVYRQGFQAALNRFESQGGYRVEITLKANNLRRSRNSTAKHWLVERGTKELRDPYEVYVLKGAGLNGVSFELHSAGVLEENDWKAAKRTVAFFEPQIISCVLDGQEQSPRAVSGGTFSHLMMLGDHFKLEYSDTGVMTAAGNRITVNLIP